MGAQIICLGHPKYLSPPNNAVFEKKMFWSPFREKEKTEVRDEKVLKILETKDLQIQQLERVSIHFAAYFNLFCHSHIE